MFVWTQWHADHIQRIENALERAFPAPEEDLDPLFAAMSYAVRAGGKRIRPLLIYASYQLGQTPLADLHDVDVAALAIEFIHTYSLVHDDLPAMDNDDFRRGKPTTHKAFSEATAILVGDALQSEAFYRIAQMGVPAQMKLEIIKELAHSAGMHGMCKGQSIDLSHVGKSIDLPTLEIMHLKKTGALLACSVQMGAILGGMEAPQRALLSQFSHALGLGFQITDDILDTTQTSQTLGKTAGKDVQSGKPTYVSLMGLEAAQDYAQSLLEQSLTALGDWGEQAAPLRAIANWAFTRKF